MDKNKLIEVRIAYEEALHITNKAAEELVVGSLGVLEEEKALTKIIETNKMLNKTIDQLLTLEQM